MSGTKKIVVSRRVRSSRGSDEVDTLYATGNAFGVFSWTNYVNNAVLFDNVNSADAFARAYNFSNGAKDCASWEEVEV